MKVLLLNPPAPERVSRDYYCGHITKGPYLWPPMDLLAVSGVVAERHEVEVLDAVVEELSADAALAQVAAAAPDVVVAMTAAISWTNDTAFIARLHQRTGARVLVSGDFPRAEAPRVLASQPAIDAVMLDFADLDLIAYLERPDAGPHRNICSREHPVDHASRRSAPFSYPTPRHELFPLRRYHHPLILHHPYTLIMSDFGCPFRCGFCYFERIDHKRRDLDSFAQELRVIRGMGIRELQVMDPAFGSVKRHGLAVCAALREVAGDFSWFCDMRVDAADEELLAAMKAAGCHTVMMGVESFSEDVMRRHHKDLGNEAIFAAFARARRLGLRTLAHFIIGLGGEDQESLARLVRLAIELDPDFASFNEARPVWNTSFREQVVEQRWVIDQGVEVANPEFFPTWESPALPRETLWRMRNLAIREFYLRPSYMLRQLGGVRTPYQLKLLVREGFHLVRESLALSLRGRTRSREP